MIISTKGRYGLRAMFTLAVIEGGQPVSISKIAMGQGLSEPYLEQLFSKLKKAKLIKSIRGAQGGYMLNMPPKEITVGKIIRALEGPLAPSDCVVDDSSCKNAEDCVTHAIWRKIYNGLNKVVDSITLQDMLDDYKKKGTKTVRC